MNEGVKKTGLMLDAVPVSEETLERYGKGAPYQEYRIPGIVATSRGTLLCCYEARKEILNDWAPIDLAVCRSTDQGSTWSKIIFDRTKITTLYDELTLNNPVLVSDGSLVHFLFCQNYERTYHCVSYDDGITWSAPADITPVFDGFDVPWNVCAVGPGHGIVTTEGRLLVPVWLAYGKKADPSGRTKLHEPSCAGAIYSDDHGRTWHAGSLVEHLHNPNETTLVQTSSGQILFNIRHAGEDDYRALAWSDDGINGYSRTIIQPQLPDPRCFGSMNVLPDGSIAFVNCASERFRRRNLTLSISRDNGETWTPTLQVAQIAAYADLAATDDSLYVFFENRDGVNKYCTGLVLRRFALHHGRNEVE